MVKKLAVLVRGTGNPQVKDIEISEGTTGNDLKRVLSVPRSFKIFRKSSNQFIEDNIDLHTMLEEGEKLEMSMPAELGS